MTGLRWVYARLETVARDMNVADSIDRGLTTWTRMTGTVVRGHGVASGFCGDPRFPGGTIALQKPLFRSLGLNLDRFYSGTINLSVAPFIFKLKQARYRFRELRWTDKAAAEDFSFIDCRVLQNGGTQLDGLIYYPHPETKPEHFQPPDILEILTHRIHGLAYGDRLTIEVNQTQIQILGRDDNLGI